MDERKSVVKQTGGKLTLSLIIIYCILIAQVVFINVFDIEVANNFVNMTTEGINNIIVSIQITLMLYLIVTYKEKGYRFSLLLGFLNLIALFIPCIIASKFKISTTIIMQTLAIVLNTVLYSFVKKLDVKEKELYKVAYIDELTGLPNKNAFFRFLKTNISEKKCSNMAVVLIDLDNFKTVNDAFSREVGDRVLFEIISRCRFVMNENDLLARIEGDEFALIIEDYKDKEGLVKHIAEFEACIRKKISIDNVEIFVTGCMGVSLYPVDSENSEELMRYGDIALFNAQTELMSNIVFFNDQMKKTLETDKKIETVVRENIDNESFELVFQPQFDAENKKLRGFETLLRMKDSTGTPISPGKFIPLAEKNGSILDIDRFVLNKAMEIFKDIVNANKELIISVNISALHLLEGDLAKDVSRTLEKNNFPVENLEIEITESVFINSVSQAAEVLNELKKIGVKIALDDFGTGYASLSYLKKLPIDMLKIDKSFIDEIQSGKDASDFVAAIISMGHLLKFDVISEGVEDEYQLDILKKLNCDYIQGYLWGKPMDISKARELIDNV